MEFTDNCGSRAAMIKGEGIALQILF